MSLVIIFLEVSLFSAILVIAAVMLSSHANRDKDVDERYARRQTLQRARRLPRTIADALD